MKKSDSEILTSLRQKQLEVSFIPPTDVGPLTPVYKIATSFLKTSPWKVILIISILLVLIFRALIGPSFVKLTTILQAGF